ncbi:MAG: hypothetical protein LBS15_02270 [Endomicrobium sp.]|jgi:hypothetical protein|nr:hypothetical protein [Endomicrobium sp.]
MRKVKRLNPYHKARLNYSRLTVKSDFGGREMIALSILHFERQNSVYDPSLERHQLRHFRKIPCYTVFVGRLMVVNPF